jgi:hypothetical protein
MKCGSTVIGSAVLTPGAGVLTNGSWRFWLDIAARGTGAGGALITNGLVELTGSALTDTTAQVLNTTTVAYDFTTACVFDVTAQWGAAQVAETFQGTNVAAWFPGGSGGGGGLSISGFYLTDGTNYYLGPNWQLATLPIAANFTWVNQGGASETATGNALVLSTPTANNDNLRIRAQALGSYTILTANLTCNLPLGNYRQCGIGFRESGTGKLVEIHSDLRIQAAYAYPQIEVARWDSPTSINSSQYGPSPVGGFWSNQWVQIEFSSSTIYFRLSVDGIHFGLIYSEAANAFFTTAPDQWYYFANGDSTDATPLVTTLYSWLMQ